MYNYKDTSLFTWSGHGRRSDLQGPECQMLGYHNISRDQADVGMGEAIGGRATEDGYRRWLQNFRIEMDGTLRSVQ